MGQPKLIVIAAPSGSGKSTIAKEILRRHRDIEFSVSATTRPMRTGETNGKEYYFVTPEEFKRKVSAGEFVEWEQLFLNSYGTPKSEIARVMGAGKSILFDVDVKGALSIKRQYPEAMLIFIRPPSLEVLRSRLENRNTDSPESIESRKQRVAMEMEMEKEFDFCVVNDDLEKAVSEVEKIIYNGTH